MNILSISTFGSLLEIGLRTKGGLYSNLRQIGLKHNQILLRQIDSVLSDGSVSMKDIDIIVCTQGPGSFTAIRIVLSTAKGLAAGSEASLYTVPTFDVAGKLFSRYGIPVMPLIDGRKGKFYTALYNGGRKTIAEADLPTEEIGRIIQTHAPLLIVGDGASLLNSISDVIGSIDGLTVIEGGFSLTDTLIETGIELYESGAVCDMLVAPLYIRKSDAELERLKNNDV